MKKKYRSGKPSGWFAFFIDALGNLVAGNKPEYDRQTYALLEISKGYRAAVDRLNDKDYVRFYEAKDGQGNAQNLYIEAYFDGMEAGLKAAGVVVKLIEPKGTRL